MSLPSPTVRTSARACATIWECGRFRDRRPDRVARLRGGTSKRRSPRRNVFWIFEATERPLSLRSHGTLHRAVWTPLRDVRIHNRSTRWQKQRRLPGQLYPPRVVSVNFRFLWGRELWQIEVYRHFQSIGTNTPFLASLVCVTWPAHPTTQDYWDDRVVMRFACSVIYKLLRAAFWVSAMKWTIVFHLPRPSHHSGHFLDLLPIVMLAAYLKMFRRMSGWLLVLDLSTEELH